MVVFPNYFLFIFTAALFVVSFVVLAVGRDILKNSQRNGWDILFLNSIVAILAIILIGFVTNDPEIWKLIIGILAVIAAGEILSKVLRPQLEQPIDRTLKEIADFAKWIQEIRIHYLLLGLGFSLTALAIFFDRYFVPSLYLLIYAIGVTHIQLLRKQEWIDSFPLGHRKIFYITLFVVFVIWSIFWFWTLLEIGHRYQI